MVTEVTFIVGNVPTSGTDNTDFILDESHLLQLKGTKLYNLVDNCQAIKAKVEKKGRNMKAIT